VTNREKLLLILTIFIGLMLGRSLAAQTQGTPSQIKGTGAPSAGLCVAGSVGQEYFQTDATAGQNVFKCTSAGVWTQASVATTEIQSGGISYCASATGNDSYACSFSPAFTAYDANGTCVTGEICTGTVVQFYADVQNTGTATFAPNGLAGKTIRKGGKNATLTTGDIEAGQVVTLAYNRVADVWQYQSQLSTVVSGSPSYEMYQWGLCNTAPCATGTNLTGYVIVSQAVTLTKCYAAAQTAPTGADLIIDVKNAGTSIFGGGTKLVIAAGATTGNQSTIANASLTESQNLTIDITQIGSTIPGQIISVKCKGAY
jgi:hypothetical protein